MTDQAARPQTLIAAEAACKAGGPGYPEPFASRVGTREKRPLGDPFGLTAFGVNLTQLAPGALSALHHRHSRQDEFVYVLDGHPTLVTDAGEVTLAPGMCAGFPAGGGAHHLENRSDRPVTLLEIGDRGAGDRVDYPRDDLQLVGEVYARKDGQPY